MELTDLHVHSTASDGTFTPSELVAEAKKSDLKLLHSPTTTRLQELMRLPVPQTKQALNLFPE